MKQELNGFSLDQLHRLIELIPAAIWQIDPKTYDFEYVSKGAEAILGYPVEDWVADPKFWVKHIHPEDRRWAVSFCQAAAAAGQSHEFEYRMIDSKGQVVWIRDLVRVVQAEGGTPKLVGLLIDVTKRHNSQRDKTSIEEQIRRDRVAETLGELTASVAHDFNNALTVVAMHADMLRSELPANPKLAESVESMCMALDEASEHTKSLMAIGTDRPSEKKQLDLRKAVAGAHRMVRRILPSTISLHVVNECATPLSVCADALRIQQVILSLALDARSSMNDGGELTISLVPHLGPSGGVGNEVQSCSTSDSQGAGYARLTFELRRNDDTHQRDAKAGDQRVPEGDLISASAEHYPAVLEILEDHRATFGYEPSECGTTIRIDFPCVPCTSEPSVAVQPNTTKIVAQKVLIAGDDQQVRDIVAATLRDSGFRVVPLESLAVLDRRFHEDPESVSLILFDTNMPDKAVIDFLGEIRGKGHMTAAIVLAESQNAEFFNGKAGLMDDGMTTVLCKPFSTSSLNELAQSVLSGGGLNK